MADTKISAMTNGGAVQPTDQVPAVRGGANVRVQIPAQLTVPTGVVKGNGSVLSAAVAGVDYTPAGGVITLSVKNVNIGTSGSPADIAQITIPSYITRYVTFCQTTGSVASPDGFFVYAESAAGTLSGAAIDIRTAAAGGGASLLPSTVTAPSAAGNVSAIRTANFASGSTPAQTATTLFIRQSSDSANAGVCSFYIFIIPLL